MTALRDDPDLRTLSRRGRERYRQHAEWLRSSGRPVPSVRDWLGMFSVGAGGSDPPFTLLGLPRSVGGLWTAEQGVTTFQAADFTKPASPAYLTSAGPLLSSQSKFTVAGWFCVNPDQNTASYTLLGQEAATNTQQCFDILRNAGTSTAAFLQVNVSANLTDAGGTHAVGSVNVGNALLNPNAFAGTGPQVCHHVCVVFDGTLSGNANRLKVYVDGVQDTGLTFTGTIPASTTASTAAMTLGYGLWQGGNLLGQMWNWGVWQGTALTPSQVAALASVQQSGYGTYYAYSARPVAVPAATAWWPLSEGAGSARSDSAGTNTLTEAGAGGSTPNTTFQQWADQFGSGNLGQSINRWVTANPGQAPALTNSATPSGLPAFTFPGNTTLSAFNFGLLGRGGSNPPYGMAWTVIKMTGIGTGVTFPIHGSEQPGGRDNNAASTNIWMYLEVGDFSTKPSDLCTANGDGTGTNPPGSTPGKNAARGHVGDVANGNWYVLRTQFAPGDKYGRVWVNEVELSLVNQGENPDFPPPPLEWLDITQQGGVSHNWMLGNLGDYNQGVFIPGLIYAHMVIGAADAVHLPNQSQAAQASRALGKLAGITF